MLSNKRELVKPLVYSIAHHLKWLPPNTITVIGMSIAFFICLLLTFQLYLPALIMFILLPLDALDGAVAKLTSQETKFGLFLDNVCDRISDFVLILGFGLGMIINWPLAIAMIFCTLLISYMRASLEVAAQTRLKLAKGLMQRTERIVLMAITLIAFIIYPAKIIGIFNLSELFFLLAILASFFTITQRFTEAYKILNTNN